MIWRMYSVRDLAAGVYLQPFCSRSEKEAVRSFRDGVNQAGTPMFTTPDDFDLYEVGCFADDGGKVVPLDVPKLVANGNLVKK